MSGYHWSAFQACGGRVREDDIGGAVGAGARETRARHRGREDHQPAQPGELEQPAE